MSAATHRHDPAGGAYHRPRAESMAVVEMPCLWKAVVYMRKKSQKC